MVACATMKCIASMTAMMGMLLGMPVNAGVPEHFSEEAKALLADAVPLVETENKLNVIYFLGTDAEVVPGYERRLSELLLYLQQFYAKEMERNGFGRRAFGLPMKENGEVEIVVVRGKKPSAEYGYDKGPQNTLNELAEYFAAHPEAKHSHHSFIIMPTFYNERYNDKNPGGVPFYGYGVNCFALDYADFDIKHLGKDTTEGRLLTKWYGGFAHELGHGLNLPHNNAPASMNEMYGEPLMCAGNYTFGLKPTFLTPASCAVLDRSETFAVAGDKTEFYSAGMPVPEVTEAKLRYEDGALKLNFMCRGAFTNINVYVQDPPYQVNKDYDAVAFCATVGEDRGDGFRPVSVTIPRKELNELRSDTQRLDLYFIAINGNRARWNMEFKWSDAEKGNVSIPQNLSPNRVGY